uniref:F-box protein n=1 Tax=Naja naja TaxID=35670 RepID=A0A8C6XKM1_NAJNA
MSIPPLVLLGKNMASIQDLPDDVLLAVLRLLPINELIWNCQLVCSRWRDIMHSSFLWKHKYQEEDADLKMPKTFYIFCHLEKNLIKNPCGEEGLDFWDTATPSNGQWKIKDVFEKDSAKLQAWDFLQRNIYIKDEWIPYQEVAKCFAAYNGLCTKSQLITLKDEGYWDQLMDDGRPTIVVKDWFYSSFNSHYRLCVKLLSEDFKSSGNTTLRTDTNTTQSTTMNGGRSRTLFTTSLRESVTSSFSTTASISTGSNRAAAPN